MTVHWTLNVLPKTASFMSRDAKCQCPGWGIAKRVRDGPWRAFGEHGEAMLLFCSFGEVFLRGAKGIK
jgi:hypothetical protein